MRSGPLHLPDLLLCCITTLCEPKLRREPLSSSNRSHAMKRPPRAAAVAVLLVTVALGCWTFTGSLWVHRLTLPETQSLPRKRIVAMTTAAKVRRVTSAKPRIRDPPATADGASDPAEPFHQLFSTFRQRGDTRWCFDLDQVFLGFSGVRGEERTVAPHAEDESPINDRMSRRTLCDETPLGNAELDAIHSELRGMIVDISARSPDEIEDDASEAASDGSEGATPPTGSDAGEICILLPTDALAADDSEHRNEFDDALALWGPQFRTIAYQDATRGVLRSVLGTDYERPLVNVSHLRLPKAQCPVGAAALVRTLAPAWHEGHLRRILNRAVLRRRGSTVRYLKGRGELSLPMWYLAWLAVQPKTLSTGRQEASPPPPWLRQLRRVFERCDWVMKGDSDTYFNAWSTRNELQKLAHPRERAYYVGTGATFTSAPYNLSGYPARNVSFHLGGTGYALSRHLLTSLDVPGCLSLAALDPIWLVHDDVGIGYCVSRWQQRERKAAAAAAGIVVDPRRDWRSAVAATLAIDVFRMLETAHSQSADHLCPRCAASVHPVSLGQLRELYRTTPELLPAFSHPRPVPGSREAAEERGVMERLDRDCAQVDCRLRLIEGWPAVVGRDWTVDGDMKDRLLHWKGGDSEVLAEGAGPGPGRYKSQAEWLDAMRVRREGLNVRVKRARDGQHGDAVEGQRLVKQ